ncbi:MAG: MBL fold metallo-hydrolase [Clostridiales bacterium]|nr:MBL fold metallo-hydrolase [Clostridiales bacterium]
MKIITLVLGPLETNCYLVSDEKSGLCAVIDPATRSAKILETVQAHGWRVGCILLTHAHFDHTGALKSLHAALPDVPIYVHALDADNNTNMSNGNLVYTDTYADGGIVSCGGLTFRVLHTPGHTPGSVCLQCGDALFTGDTLFAGSYGRTDFIGGDEAAMRRSLARLGRLEGDCTVLPGHGEDSTLDYERRTNPYLREAMR